MRKEYMVITTVTICLTLSLGWVIGCGFDDGPDALRWLTSDGIYLRANGCKIVSFGGHGPGAIPYGVVSFRQSGHCDGEYYDIRVYDIVWSGFGISSYKVEMDGETYVYP